MAGGPIAPNAAGTLGALRRSSGKEKGTAPKEPPLIFYAKTRRPNKSDRAYSAPKLLDLVMRRNYHRDGRTQKIFTLAANPHPHLSRRSAVMGRKVELARRTTLTISLHGERLYSSPLSLSRLAYTMDFKTACDRLTNCPTHDDIAEHAGIGVQTVRQARMDPAASGYRTAPDGWERVIAELARGWAGELVKLAEELEGKA